MDKQCIYCGRREHAAKFSLEHIFPDAFGGTLCNELFKTRNVCQNCNSLCGIWVDAPVIKNWFSQNVSFKAALEFVDLEKGSILPLSYMGILDELSSVDIVCEYWLGPCGDSIYHFRNKSDERFESIVGGDFIGIQKNPGTAYLFTATNNPEWVRTVLFSFKSQFKYSRRISCNLSVAGAFKNSDYFDTPNDQDMIIIDQLKKSNGKPHQPKFSITIGAEERFLCKVALGIGYNLFKDDYLKTDYASELRKGLWERDRNKRSELRIFGTGFNYIKSDFVDLIRYPGAHLISLIALNNRLALGLCLYGEIWATIVISDEPSFSREMQKFKDGIVYLVFPQLNEFLGPYDLPNFLAHKTIVDCKIPELEVIEERRIPFDQLPPFRSEVYQKSVKGNI